MIIGFHDCAKQIPDQAKWHEMLTIVIKFFARTLTFEHFQDIWEKYMYKPPYFKMLFVIVYDGFVLLTENEEFRLV